MKRTLRLAGIHDDGARFRDSYPFPSAAASALTPSTRSGSASRSLPFPFSHPENAASRGTFAPAPAATSPLVPRSSRPIDPAHPANLMGVLPTSDLIRQIDQTLDRIKAKANDLRDQIDTNFSFPDGDNHPRAA